MNSDISLKSNPTYYPLYSIFDMFKSYYIPIKFLIFTLNISIP